MTATFFSVGSAAPQETMEFCQWLLGSPPSREPGPGAGAAPDGPAGADAPATAPPEPGAAETWSASTPAEEVAGRSRWYRLVRQATDDGFSQLLRAVRREAALLAEHYVSGPGEHVDSLATTVSRAAMRLASLAAAATPGSQEERALHALQPALLRELVAGFISVVPGLPAVDTEPVQELRARVAELAALQKINSVVNSSLDLSHVLAHTVDVVAEVMHADVTAIFLYEDSGRLVLRATRGLNPAAVGQISLALGEGITGWTALYGRPVAVADAWCDRRFAYVPALMEEPYHGWLSVPIILFRDNQASNKLVGVLNIQTREAKAFSADDVAFAETVAGQIAIAIENARLYSLTDDRLREKVQQLQALQRVTATLVSSLDLKQVLSSMARQAALITGTDMAGIFELDEEHQLLKIAAHYNLSEQYLAVEVKVGEGAVGLAVAERKPIVILDAQADPRLRQSSAARWVAEEGYRSMFSVPLISRNRVLGGISVYTRERHEFSRDQIDLLFTFANDAAIAIENARLYEEMRRALEMKSTLLQEMHHRVKNNLQMMAALLRLQMRRTRSKEAAETLAVTHAQIESLVVAHHLLSQESVGRTTVQEIARRVADIAVADLLPREKRVAIEITDGSVTVASQSATLLALVLNELICNAILHGLENRVEGRVTVTAREVVAGQNGQDGTIEIEVTDDGGGLPSGFSLERDAGLGLSIIQRLVNEQLKGTFSVATRPGGGTLACVVIPRG